MPSNAAVRSVGIPSLDLWEKILKRKVRLVVNEDNETTITVIRTGKNQTMRHVQRTHDVCSKWITNVMSIMSDRLCLRHCPTHEMCADILTKPFESPIKFKTSRQIVMHDDFRGVRTLDWAQMTADAKRLKAFYRECYCSTCLKSNLSTRRQTSTTKT